MGMDLQRTIQTRHSSTAIDEKRERELVGRDPSDAATDHLLVKQHGQLGGAAAGVGPDHGVVHEEVGAADVGEDEAGVGQ